MENYDDDRSMFFVEKKDLMKTVGDVFDSLIELSYELESTIENLKKIKTTQEELKKIVLHLKHTINRDMAITPVKKIKNNNIKSLQMSAAQWNEYISRSISSSGVNSAVKGRSRANSDKDPDEVSEDINGSVGSCPRLTKENLSR